MPHEWGAFLKYAKLVRALGSEWDAPTQPVKTHASVIGTLCILRPSLVLFPNLRTLNWPIMELKASYFLSMLSLVGDAVTTLRITQWEHRTIPEQTLQASIGLIASKFRYLRDLEISFNIPTSENTFTAATSATASSLVSGLHSLTRFECADISISPLPIMHLAELGTLRELTIRLPDAPVPWDCPGPAFPFRSFSGLKKISIATTMSAYIPFSKAVPLPHIQELTLYVVGDPIARCIPDFFSAIRRQCSPTSLSHLQVSSHVIPDVNRAQQSAAVIRSADLRPLLEFTRMERFEVGLQCHHAFGDAFILDLAKAWPRLEKLYLGDEANSVHDTLPSLTSLAHLAMYAPNLEECGLPFDAAWWTEGPQSNYPGPPEHLYGDLRGRVSTSSVHTLHVRWSPIAWPEKVALFMARVFPALVELMAILNDDEEHERWEEVRRYLPMFACIRDDERLRMQQERGPGDSDEDDEVSEASPLVRPTGIDANLNNSHFP